MTELLLQTKLYLPAGRPGLVARAQLLERLDAGLHGRLTLVSAPAGFGKTTLISAWVARSHRPTAWLSLDAEDSDLARFLTYLVAAVQTVAPAAGQNALAALQAVPLPPAQAIVTALINDIAALPDPLMLVLDDYHLVDAAAVDQALAFLVDHQPPQMHLVIATREDPNLPLMRLRARGQLAELRAADLRFTRPEAAAFFHQTMGIDMPADDVATLEARTEGWIAGLQLAAIFLQGQTAATQPAHLSSGAHHFVLDYLMTEVLQQQSADVQNFLLRTSILDRFCGSLCQAVLGDPALSGEDTLRYLDQANLFLVPLDNERRWYRYHYLFADLLQQRLARSGADVARLHGRASSWFAEQGLDVEAFQHAAAANDIERAASLVEGNGMPLHFRGAMGPVRRWLESLPDAVLDARPALRVMYASVLMMQGQPGERVEAILQAAEAALPDAVQDDRVRDLAGHMAAIRALLAIPQNRLAVIISQARQALKLLHPDNLPVRTTVSWALGYAYQLQGDRDAAGQAYRAAIPISEASGNVMATLAAKTCLGQVLESQNQLFEAEAIYQSALQLAGEPPWPTACEALIGLARVHYQWNDLDAAETLGRQSLALAQQLENVDTPAACGLLLARLKLARGDAAGAAAQCEETHRFAQEHQFVHWLDDITAVQMRVYLHQGNLAAAARLAAAHELPLSQARVRLAEGAPADALALLAPLRQQATAHGWADQLLQVTVLEAVACQAQGDKEQGLQLLEAALSQAEPGGFVRAFVDEGPPMALLLRDVATRGIAPAYVRRLLEACGKPLVAAAAAHAPAGQPLTEPLTDREQDVLRLLASELSGPEIARELMVSLNTLRTHTRHIYAKLGANSRRTAVARAEELDLL